MGSGDLSELLRVFNPDEGHEIPNVILVGSSRINVSDIGEPLRLGWYDGEAIELLVRQASPTQRPTLLIPSRFNRFDIAHTHALVYCR